MALRMEHLMVISTRVILLQEINYLNSPYSARNRGIEIANGAIIALLDSTCVPNLDWLEKGVKFFHTNQDDLFGGNVIFNFEEKITAAKVYDSITNIQMERIIKERNVAVTANLWIKKHVFNEIGLFVEGIRSGKTSLGQVDVPARVSIRIL